jgi:hypothetical protein
MDYKRTKKNSSTYTDYPPLEREEIVLRNDLRPQMNENKLTRSTSKNPNPLLGSYKNTANELRKNLSISNNINNLAGLQELTFDDNGPMTVKHRNTPKHHNNCNSLIMDTEDGRGSSLKKYSRQQPSPNKPLTKKPEFFVNGQNESGAQIKSSLIHSHKVSRNNSPKGNKNIALMPTNIFKQLGNKANLNSSGLGKGNAPGLGNTSKKGLCGTIDRPASKDNKQTVGSNKKEDPVIKIHHNINHNINHNIHININHNNMRSSNVSPLESKYSKESDSSKRSDILKPSSTKPYLSNIYQGGKHKSNISIAKLTELQNPNKLLQKIKMLNDEKLKKIKAIKLSRQPVSLEGVEVLDKLNERIPETNQKQPETKYRSPKLDSSVSEEMFNKINTKDLLNSSSNCKSKGKINDSGSLISEESIFSKKCIFT